MGIPNEARLVVPSDAAKATDAAEILLDWISSETGGVWVEVYDETEKLLALVECDRGEDGRWKAVDVK